MKKTEVGLPALFLGLAAMFTLSGCSDPYQPALTATTVQSGTILSSTASLSHTTALPPDSGYIICSQGAPDAVFDASESGSINLSLISLGDDADEINEGQSEQEMAGRTPTVLMTRELFYRACEFSRNFSLSKDEALDLYLRTLDAVSNVWPTEAGRTTVTIGDTLTTTDTDTFSATTAITDTETSTVSESEASSAPPTTTTTTRR